MLTRYYSTECPNITATIFFCLSFGQIKLDQNLYFIPSWSTISTRYLRKCDKHNYVFCVHEYTKPYFHTWILWYKNTVSLFAVFFILIIIFNCQLFAGQTMIIFIFVADAINQQCWQVNHLLSDWSIENIILCINCP